jgi:hypothetical protein
LEVPSDRHQVALHGIDDYMISPLMSLPWIGGVVQLIVLLNCLQSVAAGAE